MNGIFKTLGIASDLWVCAMFFFLIPALVSRPAKDVAKLQTQQVQIDSLKKRIKEVEKINLAKSKSGNEMLNDGKHTEIFLRQSGLSVISDNRTYYASTMGDFEALVQKVRVHPAIILYCDSRVPFERIVGVIDKVKQHHQTAAISLAAIDE
jgi:biopolymer transport protein ExbD